MLQYSRTAHGKIKKLINSVLSQHVDIRKYDKKAPYTDKVRALVTSGKGGDGSTSFMHVWNQEYAGPGGANGGRGGSVYVVGNHKCEDLYHVDSMGFHISAKKGHSGGSARCHGKNGDDLVLPVPLGTVLLDVDTKEVVHDVTDEKGFLLLEGGGGGRGNTSFMSATNQSPQEFTKGLPGASMLVQFEMKSIADVGLIGYPNSGKSAVLGSLTKAKPSVQDWAFSTRRPMIGYVSNLFGERVSIVDIPGIVDGAFLDRGIGHLHLRHVERALGIVYVLDMTCASTEALGCRKSPIQVLQTLQRELDFYAPSARKKGFMVLANKMDNEVDVYGRRIIDSYNELKCATDLPVFPYSADQACVNGLETMCSDMHEANSFLFDTILERKRSVEQKLVTDQAAVERLRDQHRAQKSYWFRASSNEMNGSRPQVQSNASDTVTSMMRDVSRFDRNFGSSVTEDNIFSDEMASSLDTKSCRSLVDAQLDPFFGSTGVMQPNAKTSHPDAENSALVHCDHTHLGKVWNITRGHDEILTDEIFRAPKPIA